MESLRRAEQELAQLRRMERLLQMPIDDAAKAELLKEFERLQVLNAHAGVRNFIPQPQQIPVLKCEKRGCLVLGGNRSGKTVSGGAETAWRLLGEHPFKKVHRSPIKAWVCSQDLPGKVRAKEDGEQETHKQLEQLRKWLPKDALRGGSWEKAFSPGELTLSLANGSLAVFKGYDQGLLKFESDAIAWCWFDEEPEDKSIFTSSLLRLADYNGQWMMTATPVLSLQGKGWIEELYEKRNLPGCDYETHHLYATSNNYLNSGVLDALLGNLSPEEREVREKGMFARLGGRVLSEFDPRRHLVSDYVPDKSLRHYLLIDPGWKVAAHLFIAVDKRGRICSYAEYYAHETAIPERMATLHAYWYAFGCPDFEKVIVDAASFWNTRQGGTEKEQPSDVDEYLDAAARLGAKWFRPVPCIKGDKYAYRVKRYLACDMLTICERCKWLQWEIEHWTRKREHGGPTAKERPEPDEPIKRHDHGPDLLRYMVNELPDPIPEESLRAPTVLERHWAAYNAAIGQGGAAEYARDEYAEVD